MRIGFVSTPYYDFDQVRSWSGIPYYTAGALRRAGAEVVPIRSEASQDTWRELVPFALWKSLRKRYLRDRATSYLNRLTRDVTASLAAQPVDAIFCSTSVPASLIPPGPKVVFWTDAMLNGMVGRYASFSRLPASVLEHGLAVERAALRRADRVFFSSEWARRSAVALVPQRADRFEVLRFAPNLSQLPDLSEVETSVMARPTSPLRLLLVGVDWERKGAHFAIEVVQTLRARGLEVELDIVGCLPPKGSPALPAGVRTHGFMRKDTPDGLRQYSELMSRAHWFILPSQAECFGVSYIEASAFGVPSLANAVDGVPSAVMDGINGFLFSPDAPASEWADRIQATSGSALQALSLQAAHWQREHCTYAHAAQRLLAALKA